MLSPSGPRASTVALPVIALLACGGVGFAAHARGPTPTADSPLTSPAGTPPAADETPTTDVAAVPEGLEMARLVAPVEVEYPADLAATDTPPAGTVSLKLVVRSDGTVAEVEVVRGLDPQLDGLVVAALKEARYHPATFEGEPVEIVVGLDVPIAPPPKAEPPPVTAPLAESPPAEPQPVVAGPVRIEGVVLGGGDRQPIEGAQILAVPAGDAKVGRVSHRQQKRSAKDTTEPAWTFASTSAADGTFGLTDVPDGKVRLIFLLPGYERLERVVLLRGGEVLGAKFYLTKMHNSPYRTVVHTEDEGMQEVTRRKLSREQLEVMPGSQGDALKGIQNLPGVGRAPFGFGDILLRGAGPEDSATYIFEHQVPILFHFFGLNSVVNTQMLESIDVVPSAYGSRYGDAIGGVVDVHVREGRRDGYHGEVFADFVQAGAMVEGPVGKGSFMAGARRSHAGFLLKLADPGFTVAPRYWDYQGVFDHPVGPGTLSVRAFGSDDVMEGVDDDVDEKFGFQLGFHRVDLQYRWKFGNWKFLVTPGYRHDLQDAVFSRNDRLSLAVDSGMWRTEAAYTPRDWISWRFGTQGEGSAYKFDIVTTPFDQDEDVASSTVRARRRGSLVSGGVYSDVTLKAPNGFSVTPGVRVNGYVHPAGRYVVDPRLRAQWAFDSGTTLKAGGGTYSQAAAPEYWIPDLGNPDIHPERAWHATGGIEQALPADFSVEATGFYNASWDVARPTDATRIVDGQEEPINADNLGSGRAYGGEFLVKRAFTRNVSGWVGYTIMRSEIRDRAGEPFRISDWDQTHNLIVLAHWRLPRNWSLGARFRVVSGIPTTATSDGVFDSRTGNYAAVLGEQNGERIAAFHQLDLRVDKTWTVKAVQIAAYLDLQNAYNATNTEFRQYSFDYKKRVAVRSLPIFPSLGLKVKF